ncbi:30S ribosomal protein S5 [Candidatus Woesearchaeota archaeon]|jgi:small subunit ribosomal protein S5|nr:30S ribosomal protein S5 [Candidatus Woesearchaeota archaeon]MBT6520299.1 30S ribosomal protein S5 [Candidatus Woesearchaeota archaeon]MBT7368251.1 30S ribosomal protein S5 [Candidatus Woesearchaeota archaeon]
MATKKQESEQKEEIKEDVTEKVIEETVEAVEETTQVVENTAKVESENTPADKSNPNAKKSFGGRSKREETPFDVNAWKPKTSIGKAVKEGRVSDINSIIDKGIRILEPEIVDVLIPNLESDLLLIGQAKGKFGGGQRRAFKQTQKKTKEGNKPSFATFAIVGDHNGHIGAGFGKSRETVPAREKAFRKAKLNLTKIRRGCGSWQCNCKDPHSIPFKVEGKSGSVTVRLMPAPKGTGLCSGSEIAKVLKLAGVEDVWCKTKGKTSTRINTIHATMNALNQLMTTKIKPEHINNLNIKE